MSYEPTVWSSGDIVTAAKLNKLENGLANGLSDVKSEIEEISDTSAYFEFRGITTAAPGWKLLDNGLCTQDSNYQMLKYAVTPGTLLKVISTDYFHFQSGASVPSSGTSPRVGETYGSGTFILFSPKGADYLIVSTPKTGGASVLVTTEVGPIIGESVPLSSEQARHKNDIFNPASTSGYVTALVEANAGDVFYVRGQGGTTLDKLWVFCDSNGEVIAEAKPTQRCVDYFKVTAPVGTAYFVYNAARSTGVYNCGLIKGFSLYGEAKESERLNYHSEFITPNIMWADGTEQNAGNVNYVHLAGHYKKGTAKGVRLNIGFFPPDGYHFRLTLFTWDVSGAFVKNEGVFDLDGTMWEYEFLPSEDTFSIGLTQYNGSGNVPLRSTTPGINKTHLQFTFFEPKTDETMTGLKMARHIKGNTGNPLTILHISDIHGDSAALSRISNGMKEYGARINDSICTGDLVANTGEAISSWWNPEVMTCVGNHDSATYSGGAYNWTAVSMADRVSYYISPFESNWGITRENGKSYYYKDYSTQKVRLIVMDGMLYMGTPGTEATAQTEWLEGLLSDAITNNLHVLIATHAGHGGATAVECSFSRVGQSALPAYGDCNTPQTVIDVVAEAITQGLKFVGYLVGHAHQDNVWDATGDGTQLMFNITCANTTTKAQWENNDMYRDNTLDAYNLVTIDTTNTLVKIVRGGGADIDDHMRTRKAICFDYSTGQKVGEVL